jgi:2'-5' RNA ligase
LNNRYFVAVNLPEETKKNIFSQFSQAIPVKDFKVVPAENIHATLAFIGWWPAENESQLVEKLSAITHSSFALELQGISHFNYRVIWLGTTKGGEEMTSLAQKVLKALDIKDERFHPHFTLARARQPKKEVASPILEKLEKKEFKASFNLSSFELMQSILKPSGPTYSRVESFPLD